MQKCMLDSLPMRECSPSMAVGSYVGWIGSCTAVMNKYCVGTYTAVATHSALATPRLAVAEGFLLAGLARRFIVAGFACSHKP